MNKLRMNDLKNMNKTELMNHVLSLQEFTETALQEIDDLKRIIEFRRKLEFAAKSEKIDESLQLLFDEVDVDRVPAGNDKLPQEEVTVAEHTRKKSQKKTELPSDTPVVDIYHQRDGESCAICGNETMEEVGEKIVERIGYQPAKRYVERHHYVQCRCSHCEADREAGEKSLVTSGFHEKVDALMATPSMIAQTVVQKFNDGLPLYRQSGIFKREGLEISRQSISNWQLKYWELLKPLGKRLRFHIVQSNLINMDEKGKALPFSSPWIAR